jgi:hypothetical protein
MFPRPREVAMRFEKRKDLAADKTLAAEIDHPTGLL